MKTRAASPIVDITFGQALHISLDNYYDLLRGHVGGLAAHEYLQLKLVADPIDVSDDDANKGGYRWWSQYNLLVRSDVAVVPDPVLDQVSVSATHFADVYGRFLDRLISYVAITNLTPAQEQQLADIAVAVRSLRDDNFKFSQDDQLRWKSYADLMGISYGDRGQYASWAQYNGNWSDINTTNAKIAILLKNKKTIINSQYANADDRAIVAASLAYDNTLMMLGYPVHPDYLYSDGQQFDVNYLSRMAGDGSGSALFDPRRALSWTLTLKQILTTAAGHFDAAFDRTTATSTSITTDWNASGSGGWSFISAHADASSHTEIQDNFKKGTSITLHSEASYRLNILYPGWLNAALFDCGYVKDNPQDFVDFFGKKGTLLYYPTALIVVRGFSVKFEASQDWTYDYKHSFSASAGGGFNAFGISFGASGGYSENTKEHQVDQSHTTLTFADDKSTLRFVGYAVAKNISFEGHLKSSRRKSLGDKISKALGV